MAAEGQPGRILLTGGTGFIGSALLRRLVGLGAEVVVLGRHAPPESPGVSFLPADLAEPDTIRRHRDALAPVKAVAHLGAAVLYASDAGDEAASAVRVNVEGTAHLVAALPPRLTLFCFASSLDVYGPPAALPVGEDHPCRPATYYGASKHAAEELLAVSARRSGNPLTVLRLSQVYGPGDTSAKVLPSFVRACLRGEAPELRGDGSDTRDWVFVEDVVDAFLLALERRVPGTFNIAGGVGSTVGEALAIIRRLTGIAGEPRRLPAAAPPLDVVLSVARARAQLGYAPRIGLEEGLRRTVAWFRDADPAPA